MCFFFWNSFLYVISEVSSTDVSRSCSVFPMCYWAVPVPIPVFALFVCDGGRNSTSQLYTPLLLLKKAPCYLHLNACHIYPFSTLFLERLMEHLFGLGFCYTNNCANNSARTVGFRASRWLYSLACFIFPVMPFFAGSFKGILVDKLSDLQKEVQRESPSQLILALQIHTQICFWAAFISVNQLRQF